MLDTITKIISDTPIDEYKAGVAAKFYPIDDKWGMKFFIDDKDIQEKTYKMQKLAAKHGLAPKVGEKFEMPLPNGNIAYGYVTQILPTTCADDIAIENGYKDGNTMKRNDSESYYRKARKFDTSITFELCNNLRRIGITAYDMHWANVGYLNGKLAAIDFSEECFIDK